MLWKWTGTPCPYKGKIGLEAAEAWANDPKARPDYEKWLKENNLEKQEKEWNNAKETVTGPWYFWLVITLTLILTISNIKLGIQVQMEAKSQMWLSHHPLLTQLQRSLAIS